MGNKQRSRKAGKFLQKDHIRVRRRNLFYLVGFDVFLTDVAFLPIANHVLWRYAPPPFLYTMALAAGRYEPRPAPHWLHARSLLNLTNLTIPNLT